MINVHIEWRLPWRKMKQGRKSTVEECGGVMKGLAEKGTLELSP